VETDRRAKFFASLKKSAANTVWAVLILVTLYACYFSHLDTIGFVGPDEPRYASIARDMAETGDWVTPRLYGKLWFEKPPLYYWGAALSFKLFGVSEAAGRLQSAVCALLATIAVAWLAWRIYDAETARWVLLLLPTTVGMIGFSHAAATDMPFSAMLTIAMVAAAVLLGLVPYRSTSWPADRSSSLASAASSIPFTSLLFGVFLGLAVLAKGPAALILCGGAVLFWAFFTKRWPDTLRLLHPAGIIAFCVTALPWYILCAYRNPDFLGIFIVEHNFKRFLTSEFQHIQPFWFYAEIILIAFLPWTAALVWTLIVGLKRLVQPQQLNAGTSFLLCWAGFCVAFFTISRSKLPGYVLPAVPAIGLILSRAATSLAAVKHRSFGIASLAAAALFGSAFVAIFKVGDRLLKNLAAFAPLVGLIVLFLAVANLLLSSLFLFSRRSAALIGVALSLLLTFFISDEFLEHTPVSILSPRYVAYQIQNDQVPLADLRVSHLPRATLYGLNFYLRTDLQEWDGDPSREVYVLTEEPMPCSKTPASMSCLDLWEWIDKNNSGQLLHLTPKP
jgi:4-amino-4-deoxy-L-arabinose transferase-like glycosyltransferase